MEAQAAVQTIKPAFDACRTIPDNYGSPDDKRDGNDMGKRSRAQISESESYNDATNKRDHCNPRNIYDTEDPVGMPLAGSGRQQTLQFFASVHPGQ